MIHDSHVLLGGDKDHYVGAVYDIFIQLLLVISPIFMKCSMWLMLSMCFVFGPVDMQNLFWG